MLRALAACEVLRERNFSCRSAEGTPAIQGHFLPLVCAGEALVVFVCEFQNCIVIGIEQ